MTRSKYMAKSRPLSKAYATSENNLAFRSGESTHLRESGGIEFEKIGRSYQYRVIEPNKPSPYSRPSNRACLTTFFCENLSITMFGLGDFETMDAGRGTLRGRGRRAGILGGRDGDLCFASRARKLPRFGPNVSPSANDPMLPSRSSASRSAARRPRTSSGNVNSLLSPKPGVFLRVLASGPIKDSIEIKLPEAGERLEAIGEREQPLTTDHLHHLPPSGLLRVVGDPHSGGLRTPAEKCRPPG